MVDENGAWTRQSEAFWRTHHEAWKRSDLNQRQYCEAEDIPLKAVWRPASESRILLSANCSTGARGLSHPFKSALKSPLILSHPLSPMTYPFSRSGGAIVPRPRRSSAGHYVGRKDRPYFCTAGVVNRRSSILPCLVARLGCIRSASGT